MEYFNIPFAGRRDYSSAALDYQGSRGFYWSSSPAGSVDLNLVRSLYLDSSPVSAGSHNYRAFGFSVRCFKNSYVAPKDQTKPEASISTTSTLKSASQTATLSCTDGV